MTTKALSEIAGDLSVIVQVYLIKDIVTLSSGSIETDRVIGETVLNEVIYIRTIGK